MLVLGCLRRESNTHAKLKLFHSGLGTPKFYRSLTRISSFFYNRVPSLDFLTYISNSITLFTHIVNIRVATA